MEYKRLGLTDLEVSVIGFGCWAIGGHGYGKVDDQQSIKAIQYALEQGINFFDTADVYGFGHSEEVLSKALGDERKNVIIATKFGVRWDDHGHTLHDCRPKRVREALEGSLRRLRIDCIPLYQIHWHDQVTPIAETMEALLQCQKAGKIRYISCSNFSMSLIREAIQSHRIESLQCLYNIVERERESDMIECFDSYRLGIIAYGVLSRGLFSGKYGLAVTFGENDTRVGCEAFQGEHLRKNLQLVRILDDIGKQYGKTPSQVAIRFVLDSPVVTCALVGHKTMEQVEENTGASHWRLSAADQGAIRSWDKESSTRD